ncbi:MAG: exodeoxyribonuclease VII small subunit [Coriobacteriales bacterium]|nr:exodeoxyribonuclease VII small subunit [Coriobacteriales bacterium]
MAKNHAYSQHKERLEEIVLQIRAKELPLEKSLDLYDEALSIGARCVERLEETDFTAEELESIAEHPEVAFSGATTVAPISRAEDDVDDDDDDDATEDDDDDDSEEDEDDQ